MLTNTLFASIIVCFLSDFSYGKRGKEICQNDYTYIEAVNSSYKIHATPQTWSDAKRECAQEGASLFYAENDDEQNAVMSFRNETQPDIKWIYVGISDLELEGVFETIDGKTISEVYNNWKSDEPNDKNGDEDCVEQDNAGKMNDCKCYRKFPFICKKGPVSHEQSNSDSNRNNTNKDGPRTNELSLNDYTYIEAVNSSYKIHPTPQTWFDAKRECAQEGGSLFYAENEDEQNAVMSFRNETQPDIKWMYVGISDLELEGVFETIDGKTISEVYINWKSYEPNDKNGDEDCVEQDNAGKMNDCKCYRKFPFICKKGPVSHEQSNSDSNRNNTNKDGPRTNELSLNDYTYIEAVNSSYKIHPTPQTWFDAKRECAQEGGSLFYAENEDEQNAVMSFRNETQPDIKWMYVGISDLELEGVFETIDGKTISEVYINWKSYEPNDKNGDEDCVEQDNAGKMNDCKCYRKFPFICKKGPVSHEQSNSDSNRNNTNKDGPRTNELSLNDYTYIEAVNSSYKIHPTPQTWFDAKRECAQEGGSLFYAENEDEQNAVMSFRNETQPDIKWMYVGISDLELEGVFETIDGKTMSEVYINWKSYEPNDKNGDEDCVEQDNAGKMNDCKCYRKFPFICKKGPVSHEQSNSDSNRNNTNKDGPRTNELSLNDYTYIEAVNSSYKIHPTPQTWFDAKRECAQEGGSLFYAENEDEQNAVMSFRNETQPDIKWMYVGISDLELEGVFETIDGKTISEVYINWKLYEPNDKNGDEDCVEQDNAGKMNDCKCYRKFPFICKKGPVSHEQSNSDSYRNNTNKDGPRTNELSLNDYTYIEAVNSSYKIHPTPQTWFDAKRECAQEGGSLFYAENEDEQNAVMSFRNETQPDIKWMYVGISDLELEGVFETIDGKTISEVYNNWKSDEPNDKNGDEDCVEQDNAGKMNDCKCYRKFPFICKKGPVSHEQSNSDSYRNNTNKDGPRTNELSLNDYTYIEAVNSSYKIHPTPQTWFDAKRECAQEGGSLFYAENEDEQNAVMSFRNETQPDIKWMYVGISDLELEGVFETIDGKTMSEVYINWKSYEPNDKNGDEDCVEQDNAGKMNDCKCYRKFPFICKKGPVSHEQSNSDSNRNNTNKDGPRTNELSLNDYTYIEAVNSSYKIHPTPQTWFDAKRECAQEGGSLFYAENEDEQNAVMSFRNETQPDIKWMYVGISDLELEGVFETIDGKTMSEVYINWKSYEPNDKNGDEDCVEQDNAGKMNDCKCYRKFPFICKKGPVSHEQSNSDSNRNNTNKDGPRTNELSLNDYTYIEAVNSSYKIHPTPQTWFDAKRECAQEGGSLFYAENEDEQNAVMSFRNETQPDIKWMYVGISDLELEGVFETIDGKTISEVYNNWKSDEPNDKNGDEDCVEQDNAGKMNDCKCYRKFPFICKKGPVSHEQSNSDSYRNNTNKDGPRTNELSLNDYTYIEAVNSSYKIHPTPQTWFDAKRECAQEGASLFYAENEDEQNAVMSFRNETQPDIKWMYVGISDLELEGVFETIDGKTISEVYNNWKSDEPNDKNGDEDCVEQDNAGKMNDCKCYRKFPFICKKGPVSHEQNNSVNSNNNEDIFEEVSRWLDDKISAEEFDMINKEFDLEGSGTVDYDDILEEISRGLDDKISAEELDLEGSGTVDYDDILEEISRGLDDKISAEELDLEGSGTVDYDG